MTDIVTCSATTEQAMVASDVASSRTVEWVVAAHELPGTAARAPLNIALIIDRSGSMQGEKLRHVQQAACYVLDRLSATDRIALIAYDDVVQVLAPSTLANEAARERIKAMIQSLRPGGSTDLGAGWLEGCQAVAAHAAALGINRALLLTDGLANCGITDVEILGQHAAELRRRGVATSTFGVGLDFNEQLLELLAERGGGHFYYIERPEQIAGFFQQELSELLTTVAREATLEIALPRGVGATVLGDLPHEQTGERLRIFLGDLFAGERRLIYTQVLTPTDAPGTRIMLRGTVRYADVQGVSRTAATDLGFGYARQVEVVNLPVQQDVLARAAAINVAAAARQALKLEREGQRQEAQTMLRASIAANAAAMPAPQAATYAALADQLEQNLPESVRKQAHFAAYKQRQSRDETTK